MSITRIYGWAYGAMPKSETCDVCKRHLEPGEVRAWREISRREHVLCPACFHERVFLRS